MEFPKTHRYIDFVRIYTKDYLGGVCIDPVTAFSNCLKINQGNCYIVHFGYRLPSIEEQLNTALQRINSLITENLNLRQTINEIEKYNNYKLTSSLIIAKSIDTKIIKELQRELSSYKGEQESCVKKVRFT